MSQFEKLLERFLSRPKDFTYRELKTLLNHFGYVEDTKGKTSGSRVQFVNLKTGNKLDVHKPHPKPILKVFEVNFVIKKLIEHGVLK